MENNEIKFSNSRLFEINEKLNSKPWKYIYKELMPKFIYRKIQREADFSQQGKVAEYWDTMIERYLKGQTSENMEIIGKEKINENFNHFSEMSVFPKKKINEKKIIWQYWGQGWEYEKLPDIVKLCYKSVEKYKGDYTVIRLNNKNLYEYVGFPEFIAGKLNNGNMGYTHFSDMLRLALLNVYGGVWLDATVLLTGILDDYVDFDLENRKYFIFQRSDGEKERKKWEKMNSNYFSWDERHKVRMLSSVIFSEKNNRVIDMLLALMLTFWKSQAAIPHYFFFQILYNELTDKYIPEEKCRVISDTLPHILFSKWNDGFSETELNGITEKVNIHKLTQKGISRKNCKPDSFYDYFNKKFEI